MATFPFDFYIQSKVTDVQRAAHFLLELYQAGNRDVLPHFQAIENAATLIKQHADYRNEIELRFFQMTNEINALHQQMQEERKKYQELLNRIEI
jgi:hypothetical protein